MAEVKCVHCGKMVFEMAAECPYCKKPIANRHAPTDVSASPRTWRTDSKGKKSPISLIIGAVIIIAIVAVVYYIISKGS